MMKITNLPDIIFICGFMGAGKSTIGKKLSEQLQVPFSDLDTTIEKAGGKTIGDIFEEDGEDRFRELERKRLLDIIRDFKGVLALGGGSLQNQHLVDHIKINGLLVFIETPFSVIFKRITRHSHRPLLLDDDGSLKKKEDLKKELTALYEERLPYYRQAEITIRPDKQSPVEDNVDALVRKIRNHVSHH